MAVEWSPLAVVKEPVVVEWAPLAVVPSPMAVEKSPLAIVFAPMAVEVFPDAARRRKITDRRRAVAACRCAPAHRDGSSPDVRIIPLAAIDLANAERGLPWVPHKPRSRPDLWDTSRAERTGYCKAVDGCTCA